MLFVSRNLAIFTCPTLNFQVPKLNFLFYKTVVPVHFLGEWVNLYPLRWILSKSYTSGVWSGRFTNKVTELNRISTKIDFTDMDV